VDLLGPAAALGVILPVVRAPSGAVARGALVAAKTVGAPLGLALPAGLAPGRWFDVVTGAADEVAAGLPIFLAGEVVVGGEAGTQVERAREEVWTLVDAGITHVAIDASAVAPEERFRVLRGLSEPALERGVALDLVVELLEAARRGSPVPRVLDELRRAGVVPSVVSVRCPAAQGAEVARAQAGALGRLAESLRGVPLMRRGPLGDDLVAAMAAAPVRLVEDGGAAEVAAESALPAGLPAQGGGRRGESLLERAAASLDAEGVDRIELRAYLETLALLERLGLQGASARIVRALLRRLHPGAP
jgi:hypothetical protein